MRVINGAEIHMRLDDYVREHELNSRPGLLRDSLFGLSREGSYINSWQMNYQRLRYCANSYMVSDVNADSMIQITVPQTETGIAPCEHEQQPFGWTGKINEYVAELAVWWAFELLSDEEARRFMADNRPVVVFRYYEDGYREMETRFNGTMWMIERLG